MKKWWSKNTGFTILELLLYVGISSFILLAITVMLTLSLRVRIKNQVIAEVEQQGIQVMQTIAQTARNAESITSPATGVTAASLTLDVIPAADDPSVFSLSGGAIQVAEAGGAAVLLTNSRVTASSLSFHNLSRASTPGIVRIQFTLTHVNPQNVQEYDFQKTFTSSAALRHP